MRRFVTVVFVLGLVLGATACSGDDGVKVEAPGGGGVEVGGDGGITVEGPSGGEVNVGTGDYPADWPSDFPVPDGATPAYSVGAAGTVAVWFSTDQPADEIKAFYTSELPAAGYTIDNTADFSDANGSYSVITTSGNGWTGGIYMGTGLASVAVGFEGDFDFWVTLSPSA